MYSSLVLIVPSLFQSLTGRGRNSLSRNPSGIGVGEGDAVGVGGGALGAPGEGGQSSCQPPASSRLHA